MSDLKIDKGIPVPKQKENKWIRLVKPMKVGDSIWLEGARQYSKEVHALRVAGRSLGYRMITRTFDAPDCDGVRVWRIEGPPLPPMKKKKGGL